MSVSPQPDTHRCTIEPIGAEYRRPAAYWLPICRAVLRGEVAP